MKQRILSLLLLAMVPVALAGEKPRAMFGVVADAARSEGLSGVIVRGVLPGSPASLAQLQVGDRIVSLNGKVVNSKDELRAVLELLQPGESLEVVYCRGKEQFRFYVDLAARANRTSSAPSSPDAAVGGDRKVRPLVVNSAIREAMRERRLAVLVQLAALPDGFEPDAVSDHLQAIRHLARDANPNDRGWMQGEAGEVSLQFKDAQGVLELHGASNKLVLSVYDATGTLTHTLPLNTPEERHRVPETIIQRLGQLR